ncbi:MAG: ATP-binding protein, partial [Myxococcota bacterium]
MVLPLQGRGDFSYEGLTRTRQVAISVVVGLGFAVHTFTPRGGTLVDLGLVSFVAVLQLAPGVLGAFLWPRATRRGLLWGLSGGIGVWVAMVMAPWVAGPGAELALPSVMSLEGLDLRSTMIGLSLAVNGLLFVVGSLSAPPREAETMAAALCITEQAAVGKVAPPPSVAVLRERLTRLLDPPTAETEITRALEALGLTEEERRPLELSRLSELVTRNAAELIGPMAARELVTRQPNLSVLAAELRFLHEHNPQTEPGFAAVRRYLMTMMEALPLGICAIEASPEPVVLVWNRALTALSGLSSADVVTGSIDDLEEPWSGLLHEALTLDEGAILERQVNLGDERGVRSLVLKRAELLEGGQALLVEDRTERLALESQLAHQDRLASVGRLAAGVAHEIGNPLSGVLMVAQNLQHEPDAEDAEERLGLIVHEARRIEAIIRALLTFSRRGEAIAPKESHGVVALAAVVEDAARLVRLTPRGRDVDWRLELTPGLDVEASPQRLAQVVVNLMANACDVSEAGAPIVVRTAADAAEVWIEVEDRGPGVDPEVADRMFEPFVTTKEVGRGTGLGLAISYWIVQEHEGTLQWYGAEPRGSVFRVTLPRVSGRPRVATRA